MISKDTFLPRGRVQIGVYQKSLNKPLGAYLLKSVLGLGAYLGGGLFKSGGLLFGVIFLCSKK